MPAFDVTGLVRSELRGLVGAFDPLAAKQLAPIGDMGVDPMRDHIDRAVAAALGLPSIAPLRIFLAHEPVICNVSQWTSGAPASASEAPEQFGLLLPDVATAAGQLNDSRKALFIAWKGEQTVRELPAGRR
jgi:hypothetical protein